MSIDTVVRRRSAYVVAAAGAFVVAAWAASSLPHPPPIGIPDPGPATRWGIPLATVARDLGVTSVIGLLLTSLLGRSSLGGGTRRRLRRGALLGALLSLASVLSLFVLTASDVYSIRLVDALGADRLRSLYVQTDLGERLAQQVVLWIVVAVLLALSRHAAIDAAAIGLSFVALVPWAYGGHSAGSGSHELAVYSVLLHLVGVTVWVGGVVGLVAVARIEVPAVTEAMRRFSPVAVAAFVVVAASGLVASWTRLPDLASFVTTGYGLLVLVKTGLLVVLGVFGVRHRRAVLASLRTTDDRARALLVRTVSVELLVMAVTMGVAVALSRTPTS